MRFEHRHVHRSLREKKNEIRKANMFVVSTACVRSVTMATGLMLVQLGPRCQVTAEL